MDAEARETARLWKIHRTVHEMLQDRGYIIDKAGLNMSLDDFKGLYAGDGRVDRTALNLACKTKDLVKPQTLYLMYTDEDNVSKKTMRSFVLHLEEHHFKSGILVYKKKMTPAAKKLITELASEYHIEDYAEADLIVNITKHFLVPKHEVMSPADKKALLERYRLKETQLPRIQVSDPVARYYGVRRSQVMKITRESETAGRYVTYRICL